MIELQAEVRNGVLSIRQIPKIPSGSKNYLSVRFNFDDEWKYTEQVMVCYQDIKLPFYNTILDGSSNIPHEVLKNSGPIYIGAFGVSSDTRITSTVCRIIVRQGAITEDIHPSDPSPDIWQQLIEQYQEMKKLCDETIRTANDAVTKALEAEKKAANSAMDAAESATQASGSATRADTAAQTATTAASNAEKSKTAAEAAQQEAGKSASTAENAANRAEQAYSDIGTAVTQAQNAAQAAQQSATQAQESAKSAGDSAASAVQAQQGATDAETSARQSAAQAQKSQETATQAATNAGESAQQANTAKTAAQKSAQSAGEQANSAATSAQQTQQSQTAAAESATSAQASAAEATKQAIAAEGAAVRAETAATEVEQSAQQIAGAIDRLAIHDTAAGNPAVIRDGADWQMEGLRIYGQIEQVTTTGAQMFDATKRIVGSVINNGVQASNSRYACSDFIDIPQGTSNMYQSGGALNQRGFYDADKAFISNPGAVNNATVPENAKYIRISSDIDKQDMSNIMLCVGSTAKPYEPYTGGKPAPSPEYPQELLSKTISTVKVLSTNLFNLEEEKNAPHSCWDEQKQSFISKYVKNYIGIDISDVWDIANNVNQKIKISFDIKADKTGKVRVYSLGNRRLKVLQSNGTIDVSTSFKRISLIFNTEDKIGQPDATGNGDKCVLSFYGNVNDILILPEVKNLSTSVNEVKDHYEPYKSQIIKLSEPIILRGVPVRTGGNVTINGQQYITDVIMEKNGVIGVKRRAMTAQLAIASMNASERLPGWQKTGLTGQMLQPTQNILCTHLLKDNISINFASDIIFLERTGLTQSEWKATYPDLVMDFVFPLREPTFEPLPDTDQQAIRSLRTYHGDTVVTAGAWTDVDYVADPKLYINGIVNTISEVKAQIIELESKV